MPVTINGTTTQPAVRRAPTEGVRRASGGYTPGGSNNRAAERGETDFYLHRSYALVEVLRRAVAERDGFLG